MTRAWVAIETSGDQASVAVGGADALPAEERIVGRRQHASQVIPALQRVLTASGTTLDQIAGLVIADGPGSFTGLRIGATVAKAIAHVRGLPVRAASALAIAAWQHGAGDAASRELLVTSDALRGEVYAALYRVEPGRLTTLRPPQLARPEALKDWPAAERVFDVAPRAATLLRLLAVEGGTHPVEDLETWEPDYGRPAEAQARWERAHGRRLPDSTGPRD